MSSMTAFSRAVEGFSRHKAGVQDRPYRKGAAEAGRRVGMMVMARQQAVVGMVVMVRLIVIVRVVVGVIRTVVRHEGSDSGLEPLAKCPTG